jgi:hypothetical protein
LAILREKRADYGDGFSRRNLYRMTRDVIAKATAQGID